MQARGVQFQDLGLIEPLQRAVARAGYEQPTPIQAAAIPPALLGRDVLGCAQTGTGKTAAFSLPILHRMDELAGDDPLVRALILTPTRELAAQIGESIAVYGKGLDLTHAVIFGGVSDRPQIKQLKDGVDILVATPGRLIDLMDRRYVSLKDLEIFVLDEADRMLDMGFIHDVKRITKVLPKKRQTLFFSATMPPVIRELASSLLTEPEFVTVAPISSTAEKIEQRVYFVDRGNKRDLLSDVLSDPDVQRTLVFSRTKHGANRVVKELDRAGIGAAAIHGNKSQGARTRALGAFRAGELRVLVATDIAARGIDIDDVSHVINYDIPNIPETYVHRIGRTARAGREGIALSFCEAEEHGYLRDIERLIGLKIPEVKDHAYPAVEPPRAPAPPDRSARGRRPSGPRSGGAGGGAGRGGPGREASSAGRSGGNPRRPRGSGPRRHPA